MGTLACEIDGIRFVWQGGPYIDVCLNVRGAWHAVEVINVWNSATDRPTIDAADFRETCRDFLADGEFLRCETDYRLSV